MTALHERDELDELEILGAAEAWAFAPPLADLLTWASVERLEAAQAELDKTRLVTIARNRTLQLTMVCHVGLALDRRQRSEP